jgi:penicillin-binding protein 1A
VELYLNRVFFGSGFYGAEAASRGYFGKRAKDLSLSEAATLVGLLRSPSNLSPWRNRAACIEARNYVLFRAKELQFITCQGVRGHCRQRFAGEEPAADSPGKLRGGFGRAAGEKLVGREASVSDGYRIYTTIDASPAKESEATLRERLASVEQTPGYEHQKFADYDARYKAWAKKPPGPDGEVDPMPPPDYLQGRSSCSTTRMAVRSRSQAGAISA